MLPTAPNGVLTGATTQQLRKAAEAVDLVLLDIVVPVAKAVTPWPKESNIDRIEAGLASTLHGRFTGQAQVALEKGRAIINASTKPFKKADMDRLMREFERALSSELLDEATVGTIRRAVSAMYLFGREGIAKQTGIRFSFNQPDRRAIRWLKNDSMHWVGSFYGKGLSQELQTLTRTLMFESGLGRKEAGKALMSAIDGRLIKGISGAIGVPGGWTGTPLQYYQGLAGNIRTRASIFGAVESFVQAGVVRYKIQAVMDSRTSEQCRQLNGMVFPVEYAVETRDKMMAASSPDDVKSIAGWKTTGQITDIMGGKSAAEASKSPELQRKMADAGLSLPPYHFRCRTIVLVEDAGAGPGRAPATLPKVGAPAGRKPPVVPPPVVIPPTATPLKPQTPPESTHVPPDETFARTTAKYKGKPIESVEDIEQRMGDAVAEMMGTKRLARTVFYQYDEYLGDAMGQCTLEFGQSTISIDVKSSRAIRALLKKGLDNPNISHQKGLATLFHEVLHAGQDVISRGRIHTYFDEILTEGAARYNLRHMANAIGIRMGKVAYKYDGYRARMQWFDGVLDTMKVDRRAFYTKCKARAAFAPHKMAEAIVAEAGVKFADPEIAARGIAQALDYCANSGRYSAFAKSKAAIKKMINAGSDNQRTAIVNQMIRDTK